MEYTSPANLRALERRLSSTVQDTELLSFIDKAQSVVDAKLGDVFSVPFFPVPELIKHITTDLALYFYHENLYSSQRPNTDDTLKVKYERIMDMLDQIIKGELTLGPNYPAQNNGGIASNNKADPIFGLDEPRW